MWNPKKLSEIKLSELNFDFPPPLDDPGEIDLLLTPLDLDDPREIDLPEPVGLDLNPVNNLLQPVSLDLRPTDGNFLQPVDLGLQPLELNVQPADLSVEPAKLEIEPSGLELAPVALRAPLATPPIQDLGLRCNDPRVREIPTKEVSRGLLFGGSAIALLGAFSFGLLLNTRIFDEEIEQPQSIEHEETNPKLDTKTNISNPVEIPSEPVAEKVSTEKVKIDEIVDVRKNEYKLAETKLKAARIELARNSPNTAILELSHVLEQDAANWEAHMLMAQAFLMSGDYAEALVHVNQAQPGQPTAELYLIRGKVLEFNGRHKDAQPEYLAALKIDPAAHEARFLYGRLLAYDGKAGRAKDELTQVVEATDDRFPEAWLNLGRAQRELGENDDAIVSLAKATALDPKLQEGFYLEGRIHADRNKHAKAIELFQKATANDVHGDWVPTALVSLGRAQAKVGQVAAAVDSFKKFLEIAPVDHSSRRDAERQLRRLLK